MKRVSFFIVLLILISKTVLWGQSSFTSDDKTSTFIGIAKVECIYSYTVNAPLKDNNSEKKQLIYTTILQSNGSQSKFWDWHFYKKDSLILSNKSITADSINQLKNKYWFNVKNLFSSVIIKNYPKGKTTVTDDIMFDDYIYTEKNLPQEWILSEDTLTVCGYLCYKATTQFAGRGWSVWYTPEIPISDGPWKLNGLAGLILKAVDNSNSLMFEAIAIRNANTPIYLTKNPMRLKTNRKTFVKNKNEFEKNPKLDNSQIKSITVFKAEKIIKVNGKFFKMKRETEYVPLELE